MSSRCTPPDTESKNQSLWGNSSRVPGEPKCWSVQTEISEPSLPFSVLTKTTEKPCFHLWPVSRTLAQPVWNRAWREGKWMACSSHCADSSTWVPSDDSSVLACLPERWARCLQWSALTHYCTVHWVAHSISRGAALRIEHVTFDRFITRLWALFSTALGNPLPLVIAGAMFMHEERLFDWAIVGLLCRHEPAPTYQAGLMGDIHMHQRINSPYMDLYYKNNCYSLVVKISAMSEP